MDVLSAILHRLFGPTPEEIRVREWMDYWNEHLDRCIERYGDCLSQDERDAVAELREENGEMAMSFLIMYLYENGVRPSNMDMFVFSTLFNMGDGQHKTWLIWWPPGEEWRAEKYFRAAEEAYYARMSGNL